MTNQDKIKYSPEIAGYLASRHFVQTRSLADAIIKQVGGDKRFLEIYKDVVFNAQPRTVDGFKSTSNVINFFNNNKTDILAYIKEDADSIEAEDAAEVIHYRLYENTHTIEEVRAAIQEDSNRSDDLSRLHVEIATFATMDAFSDFCAGLNVFITDDYIVRPTVIPVAKKTNISSLILATRNTKVKEVIITTCPSNSPNAIHEHFKEFLEDNLGMTDYAKQVIYGKQGEVIESYLVKFVNDDDYYTLHSFCDINEDNDNDAGVTIEQLDINDLNKLIECLVMKGYLSPDFETMDSQSLKLSTRPLVVLALVGATGSNQGILSIGTNDSLMISTKPIVCEHDFETGVCADYKKKAEAIKQMISDGVFKESPIPESVIPEHGGDEQIVVLSRDESFPYELQVKGINNIEITNSCLLLTSDFTSAFESLTGRVFQKAYQRKPKCTSLIDQVNAIHNAEHAMKNGINNYFF